MLTGTSLVADDLSRQLEIIREGYLANRAAFQQGKCRFTYAIYTADSEADALAGKSNSRKARIAREHTLYLDGDAFTIKVELDGAKIRKAIEGNAGIITPTVIARKREFAIDYDGLVNNAIVHSPANDRLKIRYHPFNLAYDADVANPASSIEYAVARQLVGVRFEIEKDAFLPGNGRKYLKLIYDATYNSHKVIYWIDPLRSYLPFMKESVDRGPGIVSGRMSVLTVHEDNGVYFPVHAMVIKPRKTTEGVPYVEVREMKVEELDLDYQPIKEDLTIYLPKHTQFSDGINPNTAKSLYREGEAEFASVSVNDIEGIYHQLQDLAAERAKLDAAVAGLRPPRDNTGQPGAARTLGRRGKLARLAPGGRKRYGVLRVTGFASRRTVDGKRRARGTG